MRPPPLYVLSTSQVNYGVVCNSSNSDYIKLLVVSVLVLLVYGAGPCRPQPQQSLSFRVPLCERTHSLTTPS